MSAPQEASVPAPTSAPATTSAAAPRDGGRRGGRRGGQGRAGGRGGGRGFARPAVSTGPIEKTAPVFTKVADLVPKTTTWHSIVKVVKIDSDVKREAARGGAVTCSEVLVGDETGCITLSTLKPETVASLAPGQTIVILNFKRVNAGLHARLAIDNWSAIKPLDACTEIVPKDFNADFVVKTDVDFSVRTLPKPTYTPIKSFDPEAKGLNLVVKVVDVKIEEHPRANDAASVVRTAEATVGDKHNSVTLVVKGERRIELVKPGAVLYITKARIQMDKKGNGVLIVDRFAGLRDVSSVDASILPEDCPTADTEVNLKENWSKIDWVLQE